MQQLALKTHFHITQDLKLKEHLYHLKFGSTAEGFLMTHFLPPSIRGYPVSAETMAGV